MIPQNLSVKKQFYCYNSVRAFLGRDYMKKFIIIFILFLIVGTGGYLFFEQREKVANLNHAKKLQSTEKTFTFSRMSSKGKPIIFDARTNLYWMVEIDKEMTHFKEAKDKCKYSRYGDFTDWRLPTLYELATISTKCSSSDKIEKWNVEELVSSTGIVRTANFCIKNDDLPNWERLFGFTSGKYLWTSTPRTNPRLPLNWTVVPDKNLAESRPDENVANVLCVRQ